MSSIPKFTTTLALGLIVLGVGCVKKEPTAKPPLDNRTIATDQAMEKRQWPESTATYSNTAVQAGPDRFPYAAKDPANGYWLDAPLFVVNSVVLPFTYFETGASDTVSNETGASIGNGFTGIPQGAYYQGPYTAGYNAEHNIQPNQSQTGAPRQGSVGGPRPAQGSVGGPSGGTGGR